jgi:hypothetical protein
MKNHTPVYVRTPSYVMTVDPKSAVDMAQLDILRRSVKYMNASKGSAYYVKCQGRGPRVANAIADGSHRCRYNQSLPLRHAVTMDVYIYER